MARILLAVAILAVTAVMANAQAKLCDNTKAPGKPWNTLLTHNTYDAGSKTSKLDLTWRSPVKGSSDGCLDGYRVELYDGNKKLGSNNVQATPIQDPMKYTMVASPGKTVTIKIVAYNSSNKKESQAETVGTVKAAAPTGTAVPV